VYSVSDQAFLTVPTCKRHRCDQFNMLYTFTDSLTNPLMINQCTQ